MKRFYMAKVATGTYGVSRCVVGEICVIVEEQNADQHGWLWRENPNPVRRVGISEQGKMFSITPRREGDSWGSVLIPREFEFLGKEVHPQDDEDLAVVKQAKEIAKKFRRKAEDALRKGGFAALYAAKGVMPNGMYVEETR